MIYAMSKSHARAVTALVPSAAEKVATLNPEGDIEDPSAATLPSISRWRANCGR